MSVHGRSGGRKLLLAALAGAALTAALPVSATAALRYTTGTKVVIDADSQMWAIACPSTTQCTAVDEALRQLTFNPRSPGQPVARVLVPDLPDRVAGNDIVCPSATQCTTYGGGSRLLTFDPTSTSNPTPVTISTFPGGVGAFACFSVTQCTAVGGGPIRGDENIRANFNPRAPGVMVGTPMPDKDLKTDISWAQNAFRVLACPSATQCTVIDDAGNQLTFNPRSAEPASMTPVYLLHPGSIACQSATQCTAGGGGDVTIFNPQAPAASPPSTAGLALEMPDLSQVECPTAAQCVAVADDVISTSTTYRSFNPITRTVSVDEVELDNGNIEDVSCPSATQCTLVTGVYAETFYPDIAPTTAPKHVDPVACGTATTRELVARRKMIPARERARLAHHRGRQQRIYRARLRTYKLMVSRRRTACLPR